MKVILILNLTNCRPGVGGYGPVQFPPGLPVQQLQQLPPHLDQEEAEVSTVTGNTAQTRHNVQAAAHYPGMASQWAARAGPGPAMMYPMMMMVPYPPQQVNSVLIAVIRSNENIKTFD